MNLRFCLVLQALAALVVPTAFASEAYSNRQYCYSVRVPPGFTARETSDPQANLEMRSSSTGTTVQVWGRRGPLRDPSDPLQELDATFKASGPGWFAVSGLIDERTILYQKSIAARGVVASIRFTYPRSRKSEIDSVLKSTIDSLNMTCR